jgi:hypothetical protein
MSVFKGLPCRKHTLKLPAVADSTGDRSWEKLLVKSGVLYVIDDRSYPKNVSSVLGKTFGTLQYAGIPIALTCQNNGGNIFEELKLISHSEVPIQVSDLQVPKGFKLVATATDVTNSEADNQGFTELLR